MSTFNSLSPVCQVHYLSQGWLIGTNNEFRLKFKLFHWRRFIWKMSSAILQPFCSDLNMLISNLLIHVNHTGVYTNHHPLTMHQLFYFRWKPQAYWHQAICNLSRSETTVWLVSFHVAPIKLYDYHFETHGSFQKHLWTLKSKSS